MKLAALFLLGAIALAALAPSSFGVPTQVTTVEGITEYRFDNGLRVLLYPDPSKETATVCITYLVGSRHEGYGETGMAHLLEHMVFKGTQRHPNIPQELTSHGCRPNGSTWFDRTNYFETFAATDSNLAWALDMEADRMVNSFISKKDLDSEMTVVRNEFEVDENNPAGVLEERVYSTAYLWHNYGKSTIGARSDIENVPIENLQAFYRKWYQPDNSVLVVAGRFDPQKALGMIEATFGKLPRPTRLLPTTYTAEPAQDGERSVVLKRVGDTQVAAAAYHIPAGSHPDFPAFEMLANILGNEPSGRLYKALVETKMASSISADAAQFADPSLFMVRAEVRTELPLDPVRETLIRTTEAAGSTAPTAEEVDRARERLLKNWEMAMRNTERSAVGLSEWSAMGDWRLIFLHRDRIRSTTAADIQRVAATYLKAENRTVGLFMPTKEAARVEVPARPDVAAMVKDYKGGEGLVQGTEFDATPEAIESSVVRATLPSGMKVVILPKKTRGSAVQASLTLRMGDEQSLTGLAQVGGLTADMLDRGTKKHDRQQIQDEMDRLKARLRIFGGATEVSVGVETTRENMESALRLVAEILREPAFSEEELAQLKQEQVTGLEAQKSEPFSKAFVTLQQKMNPWPKDDVRYVAAPEEEIAQVQAVTCDQIRRFHADFYGGGSGEIAVVGDVDPARVRALVAELFGDWKSVKPYTRIASVWRDIPAFHDKLEAPDKESAVLAVGLRVQVRDDDPDYPALVLGNFMTGGGFLNSRLATRIRQKEGLSYGVGSMFYASAFDKEGYFGGRAIYAPQNSARLIAAFDEEMTAIAQRGFTAAEVTDAKSGWLQQRTVSRSSDGELARTLGQRSFQGRTLSWDADLERKVAALTPEQIHAAMAKYIDPAKICKVEAGDFAKAATMPAGGPEGAPASSPPPASGGKPGMAPKAP
jgi:zinc protease